MQIDGRGRGVRGKRVGHHGEACPMWTSGFGGDAGRQMGKLMVGSTSERYMNLLNSGRELMALSTAALIGTVCLAMGGSAMAQQPAPADHSSDKMILALTKIPKAAPGKASKAPVKHPLPSPDLARW